MTPERLAQIRAYHAVDERKSPHRSLYSIHAMRGELLAEVQRLADGRAAARTAANALTVFCRQAGCTDEELTAVFQAYSPDRFADGIPGWLTPQRPQPHTEEPRP